MTETDLNARLTAADGAMRTGRWDDAIAELEVLVANGSGTAAVQNALGICHAQAGRPETAVRAFAVAFRLQPDNAEFLFNLAMAQNAAGNPDAAEQAYDQLVRQFPDHDRGWFNLGNLRFRRAEVKGALEAYDRAVNLDDSRPDFRRNRAIALVEAGRHADAVADADIALDHSPDDPVLLRLKAQSLARTGQSVEALEMLAGLEAPDDLALQGEIAAAAGETGRALEFYHRGEALNSDPVWRLKRMLLHPPVVASRTEVKDLRELFEVGLRELRGCAFRLDEPLDQGLAPAFYRGYHGEDERAWQVAYSALCREIAPVLNFTAPHVGKRRKAGERLRIVFLSRHLVSHTIGQLMKGFIAGFDRTRFDVHVVAFASPADPVARDIAASADAFHVAPVSLRAAQQMIAGLEADILFFPDIGMEPLTWALAHARLAPLQCVSWGHPITTGIDSIDSFISCDQFEPEGGAAHYSEKLVCMPGPGTVYSRPVIEKTFSREDIGLREGRNSYFCGQSLFKMQPDFDDLLAGILRGDPDGEVLLVEGSDPAWSQLLKRRFSSAMPDVADRVRFLPRMGYDAFLTLSREADVLLDTTQWSGGNTALEAIALDRPMVMLPGRFMRGRISAGLYDCNGFTGSTCASGDEYVQTALRLGLDPDYRAEADRAVAEGADRLFQQTECLRELERILVDNYLGAS